MTSGSNRIPSELRRALQEFLRRRGSERPISIASTICSARYAFPQLAVSDEGIGKDMATI